MCALIIPDCFFNLLNHLKLNIQKYWVFRELLEDFKIVCICENSLKIFACLMLYISNKLFICSDEDDCKWLTCSSNRQAHEAGKLMLTQIIPSDGKLFLTFAGT